MLRPICLFAGLVLPGLAMAQEGPSFDCDAAESSAEELICADAELAALDRRLTDTFAAALAVAETGPQAGVDELRATQRGWIGGRDECWKAEDLRDCVEASYLRRDAELVGGYILQEPTSTVFYSCEDRSDPAVMFFDTEPPSARIEYGDRVEVGVQTETASGARYDASFGTYFWTQGDEAMFSINGEEPTTCTASG